MKPSAILVALALIAPLSAYPRTITGLVVGVADGDTITILDDDRQQVRIRLGEIDVPESGQAYGDRSKQSLAECADARPQPCVLLTPIGTAARSVA